MRGFVPCGILLIALTLLMAPSARATVRPPTDSLTVEIKWLDRDAPQWRARLRLVRYTTATVPPGSTTYTALAMRTPDSLVITGADSALVVIPATQVMWPGFPKLRPNAAVATAFRTQPSAPAGGIWSGAMGGAPSSCVLPNEPVDVCWFVRVVAGSSDRAILDAVRSTWFGSGPSSAAPVLGAGVLFKRPSKATNTSVTGGGPGGTMTSDP